MIIVSVSWILSVSYAFSQPQLSDSARVSLLTASPWYGEVYAFFGHTAILVEDDLTGVDVVFNYGFFDTSQPGFMYNFVRGRTDYILGTVSFRDFLEEYGYRGQQINEQELNLSIDEKQQLYQALLINALPENRGYRYNYFYDNCATRPRDMIEKFTIGTIHYPTSLSDQSYRDLVHECVEGSPWLKFGIDLVIGNSADSIINIRSKMFLPDYLLNSFQEATIQRDDTTSIRLVKKNRILLNADNEKNAKSQGDPITPIGVAFVLLGVTIIFSIVQLIKLDKSKIPGIYDIFLFTVAGVSGILIFILMFFSEHPATNPNWNFVWLNPIALIAGIGARMKSAEKIVHFYHFINFVVLTLFLLGWHWIPQRLPIATIPFSMSLWLRSGINVYMLRMNRIKKRQFTTSRQMKAGWGGI